MPRIVRCGLIQAANSEPVESSIEKIKASMIEKDLVRSQTVAKGLGQRSSHLPSVFVPVTDEHTCRHRLRTL